MEVMGISNNINTIKSYSTRIEPNYRHKNAKISYFLYGWVYMRPKIKFSLLRIMIFQKKIVKHGILEILAKNYTSVLKGNNLNEKNKKLHIG